MVDPFRNLGQTDQPPVDFLSGVGHVFAVFGDKTQDSGNVSYGVEVSGRRFFVKTAGDPADRRWFLQHSQRVALLRNAVELAGTSAHRAMVRLHHVIASPHGPMLVYDWAEGELLRGGANALEDSRSAHRRFMDLPSARIVRALDEFYSLHVQLSQAGWVAVDLYDGCLIYDFCRHVLHVVDLDHYHRGPFINEMGRMFGSTRFMAPEEFSRGATIDERTTVFTLGRFAANFLGAGLTERSAFRGPDALLEVIRHACRPESEARFPSVAAFYSAWQAER